MKLPLNASGPLSNEASTSRQVPAGIGVPASCATVAVATSTGGEPPASASLMFCPPALPPCTQKRSARYAVLAMPPDGVHHDSPSNCAGVKRIALVPLCTIVASLKSTVSLQVQFWSNPFALASA